ncbi:MAG: hypothetical protein HY721_32955 [Planctomycetes bacterium]|nr:hypothetical protein [Planctomycetota bacterium]
MRYLLPLALALALLAREGFAGDALQLSPGQAGLYEGTVILKQSSGDGSSETKAKASLAFRARSGAPGKLLVAAVRLVEFDGDDARPPLYGFDELAGAGPFGLVSSEDVAGDLEESSAEISPFLPAAFLPAFSPPGEGEEAKSDAEVSFAGLATVKAALVTRARKDGAAVEVVRELAAGSKPSFKFQGSPATLTGWSERYVVDPATRLPSRVETRIAADVKVSGGEGEGDAEGDGADATTVKLERAIALEAKRLVGADGADSAKTAALDRDLQGIGADFAAFVAPDEIAKKIEAFKGQAKDTVLELAGKALSPRLDAYRSMGLGKAAPEFTLESLEGKQVSFREATKGKVTLLSFWGVG